MLCQGENRKSVRERKIFGPSYFEPKSARMLFDQIIVICYTKIRAFPKMMTLVPKMVSVKKLLYQNVRGRNVRDGKKWLLKNWVQI